MRGPGNRPSSLFFCSSLQRIFWLLSFQYCSRVPSRLPFFGSGWTGAPASIIISVIIILAEILPDFLLLQHSQRRREVDEELLPPPLGSVEVHLLRTWAFDDGREEQGWSALGQTAPPNRRRRRLEEARGRRGVERQRFGTEADGRKVG